jgi:mono/diheme cytochrome c family protein
MNDRRLIRVVLAGVTAALVAAAGRAAAAPADRVAEGAALARDACSACHQVSPRQKPPPAVYDPDQAANVPAPSFMKIARDRRKTAAYLRQVITRPHYPMREQSFDPNDLDAIIAYIQSLRPAPSQR